MATNNALNLKTQGVTYYNGAGAFSGVDGSTSGFVLTSTGTGAAPTFQAASGGNFILLDTKTANNTASTVVFTTGLNSTYSSYKIICTNLQMVQGGGTKLQMRCSTDGGANYDSGNNYSYVNYSWDSGGSQNYDRAGATSSIQLNSPVPDGASSTNAGGFELDIYNVASASLYKVFRYISSYVETTTLVMQSSGGSYNSATAVNALQFLSSTSGNFISGTFKLYGIT